MCSPSQVDWLQQQVIQRRAQRLPRTRQLHSANTNSSTSGLPHSGRLLVSLFRPSSCSLEPETDPRTQTDGARFTPPPQSPLTPASLLFAPQRCRDGPTGCLPPLTVAGAWRRGYTGKGVVVSVLDGAIERRHPALEPNYVSVLEEDGAHWALISSKAAAPPAKRASGYFGLSFIGPKVWQSQPGLLVQTGNGRSNQAAALVAAEDARRELWASHVVPCCHSLSL